MRNTSQPAARQYGGRVPTAVLMARGFVEDMRLLLNSPTLLVDTSSFGAHVELPETVVSACKALADSIPETYSNAEIQQTLALAKAAYTRGRMLVHETAATAATSTSTSTSTSKSGRSVPAYKLYPGSGLRPLAALRRSAFNLDQPA